MCNFLCRCFVFTRRSSNLSQRSDMRFFLILLFSGICTVARSQQVLFTNKATVYLVRHGEKETGADPLLTAEGNARAGDLSRLLKDKNIRRIYVTPYRRTRNTGDSLRIQSGIDTLHYLADTSCNDLLEKIRVTGDYNHPILIIGHSNTIPLIIRKLGLPNYPADYIPDHEYDNLFVLTYNKGIATLKKMKFGAPSGSSARMQ